MFAVQALADTEAQVVWCAKSSSETAIAGASAVDALENDDEEFGDLDELLEAAIAGNRTAATRIRAPPHNRASSKGRS